MAERYDKDRERNWEREKDREYRSRPEWERYPRESDWNRGVPCSIPNAGAVNRERSSRTPAAIHFTIGVNVSTGGAAHPSIPQSMAGGLKNLAGKRASANVPKAAGHTPAAAVGAAFPERVRPEAA